MCTCPRSAGRPSGSTPSRSAPPSCAGHVVLVNFWTLTCINWLRQEPYVRAWSQAYRDDGLIVIGVHTPEFSFEHDIDGVRRATQERAIDYPVAVDNDYEVWSAFDNHYWPALYFVDAEGIIRDHHFGEGRYEQSERVIQRLLGVERELVSVEGRRRGGGGRLGPPAHARDVSRLRARASASRHLTAPRSTSAAPTRSPSACAPTTGHWSASGRSGARTWCSTGRAGASPIRFQARDAHLVLSSGAREPIPFRVLLDGEAPGPSHGVDVDEDGNGVLRDGRLYQLVRERDAVRQRTLKITFLEPGAEAYAFTFG